MKGKLVLAVACSMIALTACGETTDEATSEMKTNEGAESEDTQTESNAVSNSLFSITIPEEFADEYVADIQNDQITIYYKELKESIDRGMLFTVRALELPNADIGGTYMKIGELTTADGVGYAIALGYPTEGQWDIENESEPPQGYSKFYDSVEKIVQDISGVDGGVFEYGAGCNGADLYGDILEKYISAANDGWDANQYEENDMSPEIFAMIQDGGIANVGFAYVDVNLDGIDELVIGDARENEIQGAIYDIYTMVDGVPTHVISGSARDRYYVYESFLVNEASGGALESVQAVYGLEPNSTDLTFQWATKYDGYENEEQPWFITYDEDDWENVTEDEYNNRIVDSEDYTFLEFEAL